MQQITREKDYWGQLVIYVAKCDNYKVENPDEPKVYVNEFADFL